MTKNLFKLSSAIAVSALMLFSCTKESDDLRTPETGSVTKQFKSTEAGVKLRASAAEFEQIMNLYKRSHDGENVDVEAKALLDKIVSTETGTSYDEQLYKRSLLRVINPAAYACDPTVSKMDAYLNGTIKDWTLMDMLMVYLFSDYLTEYTIFIHNTNPKDQVFGMNGEYTNKVNQTFDQLNKFYGYQDESIDLVSFKGSFFADEAGISRLYQEGYGYDKATADYFALFFHQYFSQPQFWEMNHPFLTFNAFAVSPMQVENTNLITNYKIALGDGMMDFYASIGLADVAPQAILAHEYAHQIQMRKDYFLTPASSKDLPEATRYSELMADAYASYFLTDKRGATMNAKRVEQFFQVFYNIGDCGFSDPGHHGTFNQRLSASKFGFKVADDTQKNGHIMAIEEFYAEFNKAYNDILKAKY